MWLLRLYPRPWRERYGDEMADLLRDARWSPRLVVDLVAGAIDAWLNPRLIASTAHDETPRAKEHETMFLKLLRLRCADLGPSETRREYAVRAAVTLGSVFVLTAAWMWVAVTHRDPHVRDYVMSFSQLPLFAGIIAAMPLGSLKGRSRTTQAIFMSASLVVLVAWCAIVGFVASAL